MVAAQPSGAVAQLCARKATGCLEESRRKGASDLDLPTAVAAFARSTASSSTPSISDLYLAAKRQGHKLSSIRGNLKAHIEQLLPPVFPFFFSPPFPPFPYASPLVSHWFIEIC